ncbi:MAG: hypothetical protein J3R72DRAFT_128252 [Linnemannia gamsii]|nr:MAG: hypothetical protein J3R72DRAFT_128252 [Linnemannia gamsii]
MHSKAIILVFNLLCLFTLVECYHCNENSASYCESFQNGHGNRCRCQCGTKKLIECSPTSEVREGNYCSRAISGECSTFCYFGGSFCTNEVDGCNDCDKSQIVFQKSRLVIQ